MTEKKTATRATLPLQPAALTATTSTTSGPQTIFRKSTTLGVTVEVVRTEGYPMVLIIGHRSCGSVRLDVDPEDVRDIVDVLEEAAEELEDG